MKKTLTVPNDVHAEHKANASRQGRKLEDATVAAINGYWKRNRKKGNDKRVTELNCGK